MPSAALLTSPQFDLTGLLDSIRYKAGIPALGAAVWYGDELVAQGVAGVRKHGSAIPVTVRDRWHLGSNTMAMTATLIGFYVDQGVVRFEDTLGALFAGESIDRGYENVTLEQILQHVGGVPAAMSPDTEAQMWACRHAPDARIAAVRELLARPPAQPVGTYVHSSAGYLIAGAAMERAIGISWEWLLSQDLFAPLCMSTCGFGAPGTGNLIDQPWGHQATGKYFVPILPGPKGGSVRRLRTTSDHLIFVPPGPDADDPPAFGPASAVHGSLEDWGKFLNMHLRAARREKTLVSGETMRRLQTPPSDSESACGWSVTTESWAGGLTMGHSGSNGLWFSTAWVLPEKNLAVAVVANAANDAATKAIENAFARLIYIYVA